jgi:hypothetical protein
MEHMFMATEITDKGLAMMGDYVAAVRETVGWEVPISADHFGPLSVNSCIRLGKALTKYNLSWLEDMIPWQETELLKKITDAVDIPILTGEDIYLKEPFEVLCRNHAVDIIHPDPLTSGGILETKKIGDMAQELGNADGPESYARLAMHDCLAARLMNIRREIEKDDRRASRNLIESSQRTEWPICFARVSLTDAASCACGRPVTFDITLMTGGWKRMVSRSRENSSCASFM